MPEESSSAPAAGLAIYLRPRLLAVLFMGFSSGLPLALTAGTLGIWLSDSKVSLASIGFFSLATTAYNLKFLWSPLLDRVPIPILTHRLGRRRSWALVFQASLILTLLGLGASDPADHLFATAVWAVAVAFCSASQDIVIDAYRVELLDPAEQGPGAAATQLGYRIGMIASGAGALAAAEAWGWPGTYAVMAALMLVGMVTVLLSPEPKIVEPPPAEGFRDWIGRAVMEPFGDFLKRHGSILILLFVTLYNLGDATAGHMAGVFYREIGFSKTEIAEISKLYGVIASVVGISLGGIIVYRLGIMRALMVCGIAKMASNLMYVVQDQAGHDLATLTLTIGVENLVGGLASSAFVAYLSRLCSPAYTATQYALLSALATLARTTLSSGGGQFAQWYGWTPFFLLSVGLGLPGLALLAWLMRRPAYGEPVPAVPSVKDI